MCSLSQSVALSTYAHADMREADFLRGDIIQDFDVGTIFRSTSFQSLLIRDRV